MSESYSAQQPSVIPYVEHHTGPKRVLTVVSTSTASQRFVAVMPPIVTIDGRDFWVYWGQVSFEIPADRPCHVSARCEGGQRGHEYSQDIGMRAASTLLPPGEQDVALYYRCLFGEGVGQFSPTPFMQQ